jgi:uncharacterized membrane protein
MDYAAMQQNKKLREYARGHLRGRWGSMALVFVVLFLVYFPYLLFSLFDLLHERYLGFRSYPEISAALAVIMLLLSGPLYFGLSGYFLKSIRGQRVSVKNLFDGFNQAWGSFLLTLFMGVRDA